MLELYAFTRQESFLIFMVNPYLISLIIQKRSGKDYRIYEEIYFFLISRIYEEIYSKVICSCRFGSPNAS